MSTVSGGFMSENSRSRLESIGRPRRNANYRDEGGALAESVGVWFPNEKRLAKHNRPCYNGGVSGCAMLCMSHCGSLDLEPGLCTARLLDGASERRVEWLELALF